jgi:putative transposase
MPSTHTNLHYHIIFSTRDRHPSIHADWRPRLHAYMGGIIRNMEGVALAVGGVADHVHMLAGLKPTHRVSDVLRDLKKRSSAWVHDELGLGKFAWQEGYGAFTVSRSDLGEVTGYINGQEDHHRRRTFQEEYLDFLKTEEITFDEKYLWWVVLHPSGVRFFCRLPYRWSPLSWRPPADMEWPCVKCADLLWLFL